jgi:hypothetical protein
VTSKYPIPTAIDCESVRQRKATNALVSAGKVARLERVDLVLGESAHRSGLECFQGAGLAVAQGRGGRALRVPYATVIRGHSRSLTVLRGGGLCHRVTTGACVGIAMRAWSLDSEKAVAVRVRARECSAALIARHARSSTVISGWTTAYPMEDGAILPRASERLLDDGCLRWSISSLNSSSSASQNSSQNRDGSW